MNENEFIGSMLDIYNIPEWDVTTRNTEIAKLIYNEIHRQPVLKVKRTGDAKQFPLIATKKDGDVGYDLPAVLPYKKGFEDTKAREEYVDKWFYEGVPDDVLERDMRESIIIPPAEWDPVSEDDIPGRAVIPTGIFLELPKGYWATIEARSSTSKKMLIVATGIIDEGYRGELFAVLLNIGKKPVTINHGDRYVQLIIHKRHSANITIEEVDELSPSERGDSGFGSTGQNG